MKAEECSKANSSELRFLALRVGEKKAEGGEGRSVRVGVAAIGVAFLRVADASLSLSSRGAFRGYTISSPPLSSGKESDSLGTVDRSLIGC